MITNHPAPPGPLSEHELREAWNRQSDPFNQWDSLDTGEQLAWAQARAIAADRAGRPAPAEPTDHIRNATEMVAPPAEGEVGELVAKLRRLALQNPLGTADPTITRAADLLQQQAAELATLRQERPNG